MFADILELKNISLYQLSKDTKIPYTTLSNLKLEKVKVENITCQIVCILADYFYVSMDIMYQRLQCPKRKSFDWFKSEVCHKVKFLGDKQFVVKIVEEDYISKLWNIEWYAESFYLLAILDILSKKYNAPLCNKYDFYRTQKLDNLLYPSEITLKDMLMPELKLKETILRTSNPEFLKYNIVEGDIFNVI